MQKPIADLKLSRIVRRPSEEAIATMAASLESVGQLTPIGVTTSGEVIYGVTRLLAARKLGWQSILVREYPDDVDALRLTIVENTVRNQMTFVENADAIHQYSQLKGISLQQAGKLLGYKQSFVSKCLKTDERLTPENKRKLLNAKVGGSIAYLLSQEVDPARQTELIDTAISKRWGRKEIEQHFKQAKKGLLRLEFINSGAKAHIEIPRSSTPDDAIELLKRLATEIARCAKQNLTLPTIARILKEQA